MQKKEKVEPQMSLGAVSCEKDLLVDSEDHETFKASTN